MKELYFENVTGIGKLYLEYIFYEYENEPILFLCTDAGKNLYFGLCSDIRYEQKWIIMEINLSILKEMIEEEVDIASVFLAAKNLTIIIRDLQGYETSHVIEANTIDRLDLPKDGIFLRCDKEKAKGYLWKKEWELLSIQLKEIANSSSALEEILSPYTTVIKTSMTISNRRIPSYVNKLNYSYVKQFTQNYKTIQDSISEKYEYSIHKSEKYVETIENIDIEKNNSDILQAA